MLGSIIRRSKNENIERIIFKDISMVVDYEKLSTLDLSFKCLDNLPEDFNTLNNLTYLSLKGNNLYNVPSCIITGMKALQSLDLSENNIAHFKNLPKCVNFLKVLKLQQNPIIEFPPWILNDKLTICLEELHLSNDELLFEEMLFDRKCAFPICNSLIVLDIAHCKFTYDKTYFLRCFPYLRVLQLGKLSQDCTHANDIWSFPFEAVKTCTDLCILELPDISLKCIEPHIVKYKNLRVLNLQHNLIEKIPEELCQLILLEELLLSHNFIFDLPDEIGKLKLLKILYISHNYLTHLPESIYELTNLRELDLYFNRIVAAPKFICSLNYIDLAKNKFDEPENDLYITRKQNLRRKLDAMREHGRKYDFPPSELHQYSDDEETHEAFCLDGDKYDSEEDWDTDEYWEPGNPNPYRPTPETIWQLNVKAMVENGNFCPSDIHVQPVENFIKIQVPQIVPGQFDDFIKDEEDLQNE